MDEILKTVLECGGGWVAALVVASQWVASHISARRLTVSVIRLELLNLIQHYPGRAELILKKYDEYKQRGGNSYIDDVVESWREKRKETET